MSLWRTRFDTGCTVHAEQSGAHLHAHVELDGDVAIGPGDRVRVHGDPVRLKFGETLALRRTATVTRASAIERLWTRLAGHAELTELYEVSFTPRNAR